MTYSADLVRLISFCSSGIPPELSAEDKRVLLSLEDCDPEKYAELIKPQVLTELGFSPPKVRVETPIPIFMAGAEEVAGNISSLCS